MRIFVYEYLSSGFAGRGETHRVSSLQTEGWAMLSALLDDFADCAGVEATTLLDPHLRIEVKRWPSNVVAHFPTTGSEQRTFDALTAAADFTLLIAPEFDDILARLAQRVVEVGGRLLGPSLDAIRLSTDKMTMTCHWKASHIPTPSLSSAYPFVYKPRFGAGSQVTFLIYNDEELTRAERRIREEKWHGEMIQQAYAEGLPASVAILAGPAGWYALPAVEQRLSGDGRFHYLGGCLPLARSLDARACDLAERAARTIEGLHGWFGVDLILGDAKDGSDDMAIEINPRLTTSYIGLRRAARFNLAETMLAVVAGSAPSIWEWNRDPIRFDT
jgi:predicted ATP-grasp superfamily ATP-dependent carboligase